MYNQLAGKKGSQPDEMCGGMGACRIKKIRAEIQAPRQSFLDKKLGRPANIRDLLPEITTPHWGSIDGRNPSFTITRNIRDGPFVFP